MCLSDYPKAELLSLQFAVSIAYERAKKANAEATLSDLKMWADRIREAINDIEFEEGRLTSIF
jgi:hypothetical protein